MPGVMRECLAAGFAGHSLSVMAITQLKVATRESPEARGWRNHDKRLGES